jgi:hypothetical protein
MAASPHGIGSKLSSARLFRTGSPTPSPARFVVLGVRAYPRQADPRITLQKLPRLKHGSLSASTSSFTVGGQGTLAPDKPIKTVGSYWPYATTLFDYIRRAMPYQDPGSLSAGDTYAVAAYILNLNGLLPGDGLLDKESLPKIRMPNRDGFVPDAVFKADNERERRPKVVSGLCFIPS